MGRIPAALAAAAMAAILAGCSGGAPSRDDMRDRASANADFPFLEAQLDARDEAARAEPASVPDSGAGAREIRGPGAEASPEPDVPERENAEDDAPDIAAEPDVPDGSASGLILVNPWNAIPEGYEPDPVPIEGPYAEPGKHSVDSSCHADLIAMLDACVSDGLDPLICSSYRTAETQERLFRNGVAGRVAGGMDESEAIAATAMSIAAPGTSEHQLGLAVDIVDRSYQRLDRGQEGTAVQRWLMENCWDYGFILRYPDGKGDITGIIYEPWHYRHVGREAALEIRDSGLCLEEWLGRIDAHGGERILPGPGA